MSSGEMRTFDTGATRSAIADKFDYEGFISPLVIERYGQFMHKHRVQADGNLRDSDNWQKGIPKTEYVKSLFRHFLDLWKLHRGFPVVDKQTGLYIDIEDTICAILFNAMGLLFEILPKGKCHIFPVDPLNEQARDDQRDFGLESLLEAEAERVTLWRGETF